MFCLPHDGYIYIYICILGVIIFLGFIDANILILPRTKNGCWPGVPSKHSPTGCWFYSPLLPPPTTDWSLFLLKWILDDRDHCVCVCASSPGLSFNPAAFRSNSYLSSGGASFLPGLLTNPSNSAATSLAGWATFAGGQMVKGFTSCQIPVTSIVDFLLCRGPFTLTYRYLYFLLSLWAAFQPVMAVRMLSFYCFMKIYNLIASI